MASVIQRKNSYYVVYTYIDENGERKQKWESYKTAADAKKRKTEIEFKEQLGTFTVPKCRLLSELLEEYVSLYGKNRWAVSTYQGNVSLIEHYINPYIGNNKISEINTRVLERFYQDLLKMKAADRKVFGVTQKSELKKLIEDNDLPPVVFHSFRHSSITYKVKLNGGDVKSVQGDSGHAQTKMVTDLYAHILDDDRRINAQRFEEAFYSGRGGNDTASAAVTEAVQAAEKGGIDPAQLAKILSDLAMAALIKSLAAKSEPVCRVFEI